jgi:hypothetical protein
MGDHVALLSQVVALLTVHWFADFVLQTSWQAGNKHRRLDALAGHVAVYTIVIGISASVLFPFSLDRWALFTTLNGALHFATDFVTSRISSALQDKEDRHLFFIAVGFDQLLHQVTLIGTMWLVYYR